MSALQQHAFGILGVPKKNHRIEVEAAIDMLYERAHDFRSSWLCGSHGRVDAV